MATFCTSPAVKRISVPGAGNGCPAAENHAAAVSCKRKGDGAKHTAVRDDGFGRRTKPTSAVTSADVGKQRQKHSENDHQAYSSENPANCQSLMRYLASSRRKRSRSPASPRSTPSRRLLTVGGQAAIPSNCDYSGSKAPSPATTQPLSARMLPAVPGWRRWQDREVLGRARGKADVTQARVGRRGVALGFYDIPGEKDARRRRGSRSSFSLRSMQRRHRSCVR